MPERHARERRFWARGHSGSRGLSRLRRPLRGLVGCLLLAMGCAGSHVAARHPRSATRPPAPIDTTTAATGPLATPLDATAPEPRATTTTIGGAPRQLAGRIIALDPGHNGGNHLHTAEINRLVDIGTQRKACDTTGTASADGYAEAAYTFDVATRLAGILRTAGARVVLTRTDNNGWGPCIDERAAIANRAGADVALSIHADGGPSSGRGFHVIYPPSLPGLTDDIAAASRRLALDVRAAYAQGTGVPYATYIGVDGLDQRRDLGGLNLSDVPKVFIETGNMGNATDARLIEDPAFRDRVARALMMGIRAFVDGR